MARPIAASPRTPTEAPKTVILALSVQAARLLRTNLEGTVITAADVMDEIVAELDAQLAVKS